MAEIRLIDANALKEKAFITYQSNGVEIEEILVVPIGEIDNAPTVEQKYYERVIAQINPVIEARPQGEFNLENFKRFVEGKIDMQDLYLPVHLFMLLDEYLDMKGGAEE